MSSARLPQRVGLRLAASLGHRLGEVREEHREPEPERHREDEPRRGLALAGERLDEEHRREEAADLDDEHDRVLELMARVELLEGVDDRALDNRALEEPRGLPMRGRRSAGFALDGVAHRPETALQRLRICSFVRRSGAVREQVLDDGAERERRDERERADDDDRRDEHPDEERGVRRQRARVGRDELLLRERARDRERRDDRARSAPTTSQIPSDVL